MVKRPVPVEAAVVAEQRRCRSVLHPVTSSIMSRPSRHFSRCSASAGIPALRRRSPAPGGAGSQDSGTNSRQSAGQDAVSVTRFRLTPTWQLVTLPAVPVYCRATHTDAVPHLSQPVSSTAHAAGRPPRASGPRDVRAPRRRPTGCSSRSGSAPARAARQAGPPSAGSTYACTARKLGSGSELRFCTLPVARSEAS